MESIQQNSNQDQLQIYHRDLDTLDQDSLRLEVAQRDYQHSLWSITKHQLDCEKEIKHLKKELSNIQSQLRILKKRYPQVDFRELEGRLDAKYRHIGQIQKSLPKPNGMYLNIVLGSVDVTLLNRQQRLDYKEQYEQFKLWVTSILLLLSAGAIYTSSRSFDSLLHFTLVWFHCVLTIRESILVVNGSRIKGWWRLIHFLTTVTTGFLLVWPDGSSYSKFRTQFLVYICSQALLRFAGYYFQSGALYRLRSLGERPDEMDITMQGFHSWMWSGLAYLLPFQLIGYILQANLSYTLFMMFLNDPQCVEWQVPAIAVMYAILSLGNLFTTFIVMFEKAKEKAKETIRHRRFSRANR